MDLLQPGRIQQLTGLDLGRHEDRMRADLALLLLKVNAGIDEGDVPRGASDPSAAGSACLAPGLAYEMACRITSGAVPAPLPARVGVPQIS